MTDAARHWEALVAHWPGYVFVVDASNRITFLSRNTRLLDAGRDVGRDLLELVQPDQRESVLRSLADARAGLPAVTPRTSTPLPDGTRRWHESRMVSLGEGSVLLLTEDVTDDEERRLASDRADARLQASEQQRLELERMAARLAVLADASREFSEATGDYQHLLDVIAGRLGETLGDLCAIRALSGDGTTLEVGAVYHRDPEVTAWVRELLTVEQALGEGAMGRVAVSGQPIFLRELGAAEHATLTSPRYRAVLERLSVGSAIVVPLLCRGTPVGAVSLLRSGHSHPYEDADLQLVRAMADHAGQAITNARSYAAERAARTEATRASEALHQSETAHRLLFEGNPIPLVVFDVDTLELLAVNDAMSRQYGYERDELLRIPLGALRLDGDVGAVRRTLSAMANDDGAGTTWHRRKDGSRVLVEYASRPLAFGGRRARLAVFHDVSVRHDAEQSRALLAAIVESANDAIISKHLDGTITSWNAAAERLFGVPAAAAIGRSDASMIPPDRRSEDDALVGRATSGGWTGQLETERLRSDGSTVAVAISVAPIRDTEGNVVGASQTVRDLTAQRLAEAALHATEGQLRQSQKMDAVGRMAGGIAHDFNNLLSVILSYGEVLLGELPPGDPMRADLTEIQRAAERAADLTRQLLMFSRKQLVAPRVLDLNEVLEGMASMLGRILGEDIELTFLRAPALGQVLADQNGVEQIIMNLVVNARDAMPTGGKLTIETANAALDADFARTHPGAMAGSHVLLAVSDTGCGMDALTQSRIFEPFFTTKEAGKGTGLGLSTVFGITQQSGGTVWVYSEPGVGTVFKVYLPRVNAEADVASGPVASTALGGSETILLAEDEEQVRKVTVKVLERNGYRVLAAATPAEALLLGESYAGEIDLLLTDVVMPLMGGAELARRVTQARPNIRVLWMSGYTDDGVVRHGVLESEMAFLQKPFTPDALARKVREVLDAPREESPR